MNILVINCGSSSLKYQLIASSTEAILAKGLCERIGIDNSLLTHQSHGGEKIKIATPLPDHMSAMRLVIQTLTDNQTGVIQSLTEIDAVGHRVAHGAEHFSEAAVLDQHVIKIIEDLAALTPLHTPAILAGIRSCMELMPDIPMVAVFDTAFHQTMPEKAFLYGLPYSYYEKHQIRRYGFHGTSHDFVSKRAAEILGKDIKELKIIVCHLGNGASVSAIKHGKSIDTSMGYTPVEGLLMGTRSGDIDPCLLPIICEQEAITTAEAINILNKKSGVLGLSDGLSSDFRDLAEAADKGNTNAKTALDAYAYKVGKYIGAYAAAMNGVDAICFTAGVGENNAEVRSLIGEYIGFLGTNIDPGKNRTRGKEIILSDEGSKVVTMVIPTNEELSIARQTAKLL